MRGVYAPIVEEDKLLHLGGSFKYHKPNNTTAATDAADLRPGQSSEREETDVLGGGGALTRVSAAQDLSCGASAASLNIATTGVGLLSAPFARRSSCLKYSYNYGFEAAAAYGPVSLQAEYIAAQYERDATNCLIYGNGGGTSLRYSGYYVFGSVFLTGESRAASYKGYDKDFNTPGSFGEVQIKNPLNKGGHRRLRTGRALQRDQSQQWRPRRRRASSMRRPSPATPRKRRWPARRRSAAARSNLTLALNWYPVKGVRFQANWTKTLTLIAPSDRPYPQWRPSQPLPRQGPDLLVREPSGSGALQNAPRLSRPPFPGGRRRFMRAIRPTTISRHGENTIVN